MSNDKKENDESLSLYDKWMEQMNLIQEKTGIKGNYVIGFLLASILIVSLGYFERFITNLVGTVYPAFWTMKSIESKGDDDKHWLTYWVVFACFTIIDIFSGFILKFIPFYFFLKIIFLIWLFMPNSKGCNLVYHLLVVRVFKSFEKDIDKATEKITEYTKEIVNIGTTNLLEHSKTTVNKPSTKTKEDIKTMIKKKKV
jgi:receptor expression-enhancing protein 5/6